MSSTRLVTIFLAGVLILTLIAFSVMAAEPLKSGPQVGAEVLPFEPLNLTGRFAGQNRCLV